jgi:hypothetical protein
LKEKENRLLPTQLSIADPMKRPSIRDHLSFSKKNPPTKVSEKRYFEGEKIELGLAFPGEDYCALVLQIYATFSVHAEFLNEQKKSIETIT